MQNYKDMPEVLLFFITVLVLLPILLSIWLWYFHDRHIARLREELLDIPKKINKNNHGRGITINTQEMQIKAAQKPIEAELKRMGSRRQLFLERAYLISLFKIK